jgi:hypothetical protein
MEYNKPQSLHRQSPSNVRALAAEWRQRARETNNPHFVAIMLRTAEQLDDQAFDMDHVRTL